MSLLAIRGGRPDDAVPNWVVIGVRQHDGKVALYASKDLTDAELRYEADLDDDDFVSRRVGVRSGIYHATVGMRTFTCVVADSYEQALRTLFKSWSPEPDPEPAKLEIGR